jgi:predicted house-cleaning noncanonical NTP pyrophosphatase (MazG superfamily)
MEFNNRLGVKMTEKVYNKLVRDRIPEIIDNDGKSSKVREINGDELKRALVEKLSEEGREYLECMDSEELADILEVLYALIESNGSTLEEIEAIRQSKKDKRGGFSKGIFLESVLDLD